MRKQMAVITVLALAIFMAPAWSQTAAPLSLAGAAQWVPLGPEGGDVRSLAYDPRNPDHIYLGTSTGELYLSTNNGQSWSRFAHLGHGTDYVLDHIAFDPQSGVMYVAAWDGAIEHENGDLFRSSDGGRTWQALPAVHGKSIRAMALAASDPKIIIVGALDGVFRSRDGGNSFERISPPNHAEIKNIESVAADPKDPNIIYAGTWHLAWKTADGGHSWHSIKKGVIDDSDVFSIIVDPHNPQTVYLSACSGIYKSENQAELFQKIQGMPFSARRTRVLKQDPSNPAVVYAGTTEGLWKTVDAGKTWQRITGANIIVNDVHIDPRQSARLLIATDRGGVLASNDAGQTFTASNRGFAHRYVSSVVADGTDPDVLYAAVVNDKEFGGVFASRSGGAEWKQLSGGLGGRDVFVVRQAENGALVAGTNQGVFLLEPNGSQWRPINAVATERTLPGPKTVAERTARSAKQKEAAPPRVELVKSEFTAQVNALALTPKTWFLASPAGLYATTDEGKMWQAVAVHGASDFVGVRAAGNAAVLAWTHTAVFLSTNDGATWAALSLPSYVTPVYGGAMQQGDGERQLVLWLATREGAFRSDDAGATWNHVLAGLPARQLAAVQYDGDSARLLAIAGNGDLFASRDGGRSWQQQETGYPVRSVTVVHGRLLAATAFDGVIAQREPAASAQRTAARLATVN